MKRALAERAKQSLPPVPIQRQKIPPSSSAAPPSPPPPSSPPKQKQQSNTTMTTTTTGLFRTSTNSASSSSSSSSQQTLSNDGRRHEEDDVNGSNRGDGNLDLANHTSSSTNNNNCISSAGTSETAPKSTIASTRRTSSSCSSTAGSDVEQVERSTGAGTGVDDSAAGGDAAATTNSKNNKTNHPKHRRRSLGGGGDQNNNGNVSEQQEPPLKIPRLQRASTGGGGKAEDASTTGASTSGSIQQQQPEHSSSSASTDRITPMPRSSRKSDVDGRRNNTLVRRQSSGNGSVGNGSKTNGSAASKRHQHNDQHHHPKASSSRGLVDGERHGTASGNNNNNNDDDSSSAFYLRHQNRALATELKSLQHSVSSLRHERDIRRRHCRVACQSLNSLQATWTQMETALISATSTMSTSTVDSQTIIPASAEKVSTAFSSGDDPSSKGLPGAGDGVGEDGQAGGSSRSNDDATPTSVEWTVALQKSLAELGQRQRNQHEQQRNRGRKRRRLEATDDTEREDCEDSNGRNENQEGDEAGDGDGDSTVTPEADDHHVMDLSRISSNVAARATVLQERIWDLLQRKQPQQQQSPSPDKNGERTTSVSSSSIIDRADRERDASLTVGRLNLLESQVSELTTSRDEMTSRERRVRRNVYRLSSGMMSLEQVVKALESDKAGDDVEEQVQTELRTIQQHRQQEEQQQHQREQQNHGEQQGQQQQMDRLMNGHPAAEAKTQQDMENDSSSGVSSARVRQLQARTVDLEQAASNRERFIEELTEELRTRECRINELTERQQSDDDAEKLESLEATRLKLSTNEKIAADLRTKLDTTRERWSSALANERAALSSIDEQLIKFNKRWSDFVVALDEDRDDNSGDDTVSRATDDAGEHAKKSDSKKAVKKEEEELHVNGEKKQSFIDLSPLRVQVEQSKKVMELQHKLHQALENVRQAEATKESLAEALRMNETLKGKLDEVKGKYTALQTAARNHSSSSRQSSSTSLDASTNVNDSTTKEGGSSSSSRNNASESTPSSGHKDRDNSSSTTTTNEKSTGGGTGDHGSSSSSSKIESLKQSYRRARKDLAAMTQSKESAKAKLERSEKERVELTETNSRLLKQITEKDEMNAKSLSTILHLKSMTEQLNLERINLEQQAKSANQAALAARLLANAKDRVSEEILKEKKTLEAKVEDLERESVANGKDLERLTLESSGSSAKVSALERRLANATKRSEELVDCNEIKRKEIRELVAANAKVEKEAGIVKEKLKRALGNSDGHGVNPSSSSTSSSSSSFTVEQLNTQITVLKGRLACPVCHYRDKECIIMRCRHMHCRQCVEERISNRSRKCPTCNVKFSEKDVEDVWLS